MQQLPIGISEFTELKKSACLYVDKTKHVYSLLTKNRRTFLSRPRRFGKSLLVSTLEAALQGKKEFFRGLWIEQSDYEWNPYGVIRLDFSELAATSVADFKEKFLLILLKSAAKNNVVLEKTENIDALFMQLIAKLASSKKSVALLIDEYDSPILYALHNKELAKVFREIIKSFSFIVKANQEQVAFVFITGVSAFSKSGLSSGLNNLKNLTMDEQFFDICGYTDEEVDYTFKEYIENWSKLRQVSYDEVRRNLREWYNGYRFVENTPTIYSPFSFTSALDIKKLQNFWFESATPQVLIDELSKEERRDECKILELDKLKGTGDLLQTFEIETLPLTALLFQMGYLTIDSYNSLTRNYHLKYPNLEVRASLNRHLVSLLTKQSPVSINPLIGELYGLLVEEKMDEVVKCLTAILSHIPYPLHIESEKFYHALLQTIFFASGVESESERLTSIGRMDLVLSLPNLIYIVEVKINQPAEEGVKQIEQQKYYEPFIHSGKPIRALGISFTRKKASKKGSSQFVIACASKKIEFF